MTASLRASESNIWVNCPGSTGLTKHEVHDTMEAREGTLCHLVTQILIDYGDMDVDSVNRLPAFTQANDTGLLATSEHVTLARGAASFCHDLTGVSPDGTSIGLTEQRFDDTVLPTGVSGTADFITYDEREKTLHVVDFKFGYAPVEACGNTQLLCYSLGAARLYTAEINTIAMHIYQPRNFTTGPVSSWCIPAAAWNQEIAKLHEAAQEARKEGGLTRTGPWCVWCKSRLYCHAFVSMSMTVYETVDLSPEDLVLTGEQYGAALHHLTHAETLIKSARKAFEALILSRLEKGEPTLGWCTSTGTGRRTWNPNAVEALKALGSMFGVPLTVEKPVSITDALRYSALRPAVSKLMTKQEGARKLVPFNEQAIKKRLEQ